MDLTIYLAQVFGLYLIVAGFVVLARQKYFVTVVAQFVEQRLMRMVLGAAELIAGLFLVTSHNIWTTPAAIIISLFGWTMLIEGVGYLALSDKGFKTYMKKFNKPSWYRLGGLAALILGFYLAGVGFGYIMM